MPVGCISCACVNGSHSQQSSRCSSCCSAAPPGRLLNTRRPSFRTSPCHLPCTNLTNPQVQVNVGYHAGLWQGYCAMLLPLLTPYCVCRCNHWKHVYRVFLREDGDEDPPEVAEAALLVTTGHRHNRKLQMIKHGRQSEMCSMFNQPGVAGETSWNASTNINEFLEVLDRCASGRFVTAAKIIPFQLTGNSGLCPQLQLPASAGNLGCGGA